MTIATRGPTAAAAAAENARLVKSVNEALQQAGLRPGEIVRTRFRSNPRWEYDASFFRPRRSSYEAVYDIDLRTDDVGRIGELVDAALNGGATAISDVEFGLKDESPARHRALAQAVAGTQLEPSDVSISARVLGRWQFIPAKP